VFDKEPEVKSDHAVSKNMVELKRFELADKEKERECQLTGNSQKGIDYSIEINSLPCFRRRKWTNVSFTLKTLLPA